MAGEADWRYTRACGGKTLQGSADDGGEYFIWRSDPSGGSVRLQAKGYISKEPAPTAEEMEEMFLSREGEERLMLLRMEIDDELERLHDAIQIHNTEKADACREALRRLSGHLLMLEG